ncbi:MAG: response regulator [Reichenbachiella sp.]
MKGVLAFLIFSVISVSAKDNKGQYIFSSINGGMTKSAITSFIQDENGFIWISTFGSGLYRYDGLENKEFIYNWEDSTSINSNFINEVFEDSKGTIWVATETGICTFDKYQESFQELRIIVDNENYSQQTFLCITEDSDGNILFTSAFHGLFKYDPKLKKFLISSQDSEDGQSKRLRKILELPNGQILIAGDMGLIEYYPKENKLDYASFFGGDARFQIKDPTTTLFEDIDGNIWVGTQLLGLYKLTPPDKKKIWVWKIESFPFTDKRILSIEEDQNGLMLIGTENDGLWVLDKKGDVKEKLYHDKFDGEHIKSNSIWSIFKDSENRIWLGYYDKGVGLYDPIYDKFQHLSSQVNELNSLQVGSVTSIAQDESGNYWIGMDGGGIDIYYTATNTFEHTLGQNTRIKGLNKKAIQTIHMDSKNGLWAGSWEGGLLHLPNGSLHFDSFDLNTEETKGETIRVMSLDEDSNGVLWIGTFGHGVLSFDPKTKHIETYSSGRFREESLYNADLRKILVDKNDDIWLGTTRGLYRLKGDQSKGIILEQIELLQDTTYHPSTNHILSLFQDKNTNLWIGTSGGGLCRYDIDQGEFEWFNQKNGLGQLTINAILEDENGRIWVSGQEGITVLDLELGEASSYTANDGLLSNDFNFNAAFKDKNGHLVFGNHLGVDFLDPENIITNVTPPKVYLTGLLLFNEPVEPGQENGILDQVISKTDQITLTYEQSVFTIQFVGLNYTRPEENKYAYYLEGLESNWNFVGNNRQATYTSLKNGEYILKIKSSNNDGVWSDHVRELKITILPPWYRSQWSYLTYSLLLILLLYLFYKIATLRIHDKQAVFAEVQIRKQEQELHDKKLQFFTNISHEFRTPLTLIINPLRDALLDKNINLPLPIREKIQVAYKNSNLLKRLVDELMDFRKLKSNKMPVKIENIETEAMLENISNYFKEEASSRGITFDVTPNPINETIWVDKGMFEKVFFNLLSNAFKVTPRNGNIKILTNIQSHEFPQDKAQSDSLRISVIDTGSGLTSDQIEKIFDRFYQIDKKNKDYFGGTGIGLEVVKDFVDLNKGDIQVLSTVGKGTSFEVYFRLGKSHTNETSLPQKSTIVEEPILDLIESLDETNSLIAPPLGSEKLVLVVEDNQELGTYLKKELSPFYKVILAKDGKEGYDLASNQNPDIIITDVMMPEMTGTELCTKLRKDLNTSHIPILMLTAKGSIEDQIEGVSSGADVYITKPFDMRVVLSHITQMIQNRDILFSKFFKEVTNSDESKSIESIDKVFVQKLIYFIHQNIDKSELRVESLAAEFHVSRSQLYRKIKALTGSSANEFTRRVRMDYAKQLIEKGDSKIVVVSRAVGFSSPSYFSKCYKDQFGHLPTEEETSLKI